MSFIHNKYIVSAIACVIIVSLSACREQNNREVYQMRSEDPVKFRWDFTEPAVNHWFNYKQKMIPPWSLDGKGVDVSASLAVKSNGDGTATVVLEDVIIFTESGDQHSMPSSIYSGMKEYGSQTSVVDSQEAMIRLLFSLPDIALAPGNSVEQEVRLPVSLNKVQGYMPIRSTITLLSYERVDSSVVGKFKVNFDSGAPVSNSETSFPENYLLKLNGSGTFDFDPEKHLYLGGNLDFRFEMGNGLNEQTNTTTTYIKITPTEK